MRCKGFPSRRRSLFWGLAIAVALTLIVPTSNAQVEADDDSARLARWVALDAPTGHEPLAIERLLTLDAFTGFERDAFGNAVRRVGSGSPRRVVACGLDSYGYAITRIGDDGYLRLHRIGRGSGHALWDQFHEGQQMRILTAMGPVVGVTAIANGHFAFQHRDETSVVTADDLWLDVGLSWPGRYSHSPAEVLDLRDLADLPRVILALATATSRD